MANKVCIFVRIGKPISAFRQQKSQISLHFCERGIAPSTNSTQSFLLYSCDLRQKDSHEDLNVRLLSTAIYTSSFALSYCVCARATRQIVAELVTIKAAARNQVCVVLYSLAF